MTTIHLWCLSYWAWGHRSVQFLSEIHWDPYNFTRAVTLLFLRPLGVGLTSQFSRNRHSRNEQHKENSVSVSCNVSPEDAGVRAPTLSHRAAKAPLCIGTCISLWPLAIYRGKKMLRNTSSHNEMFSSLSPFQKHVTVGHYKLQWAFHLYVPASWRTQGRSAVFIATARHPSRHWGTWHVNSASSLFLPNTQDLSERR